MEIEVVVRTFAVNKDILVEKKSLNLGSMLKCWCADIKSTLRFSTQSGIKWIDLITCYIQSANLHIG